MGFPSNAIVVAYHGCDVEVANRLVISGEHVQASTRVTDWLGPGAYFWEGDARRALEWAKAERRPAFANPVAVGAVIELGNCLDLTRREDIELLRVAFQNLRRKVEAAGDYLPQNRPAMGEAEGDRLIRQLDNAVLKELHATVERGGLAPYDSVRAMFREGPEIYPGAGFYQQTHVQIAVLDPAKSIRGYF